MSSNTEPLAFVRLEDNKIVEVRKAVRNPDPSCWILGPLWAVVGDDGPNEDGRWVKTVEKVWTRAEFLDRVDKYAPGMWERFIAAKDGNHPIAKYVYERGWVPHTEIRQRYIKTLQMMGALKNMGLLTAEQLNNILNA